MTHRKGAIWTERLLLGLILASLGATLNLLVIIHRHSAAKLSSPDPAATAPQPSTPVLSASGESKVAPASPKHDDTPDSAVAQKSPEPAIALPPPEDPTKKALAALETAAAKEIKAGGEADRRTLALQAACESAVSESQRWKRREMLVRQQIAGLTDRAARLERDAESLDAERDVLAHERDALKAALTKASQRSGFAVLPYKGPNGTWRRPIVLDCKASGVTLERQGRTFTALELSPLFHPRSSPFVRAIANELLHIRSAESPDGAPVVPYLVFLVRPDGIRGYYEARSCLEPLGIAFGYELIEQDLVVDIPNFDDLTTWDGSVPLEMPLEHAPQAKSNAAMLSSADKGESHSSPGSPNRPRGDQESWGGWPERSSRPGHPDGSGAASSDNGGPEDFVWPGRARQAGGDKGPGSGTVGLPRQGDQLAASGMGQPAGVPGGGRADSEDVGGSSGGFFDQQPPAGEMAGPSGSLTRSIGSRVLAGTGSGSSAFPPSNGNLPAHGQRPSGGGSGPGEPGSLSASPDLEPAGANSSPPPLQPRPGLSTRPAPTGLGNGSQSQGFGAGQTRLGSTAPRGVDSTSATPGGVGSSSATPGGAGSSSATPGGAGSSSATPGGAGLSSGTPGGVGRSSATPGGGGQTQAFGQDRPETGTGSPGGTDLTSLVPGGGPMQGSSLGQAGTGSPATNSEDTAAPGAGKGDQSQGSGGNPAGVIVPGAGATGSSGADPGRGGPVSGLDPPLNGAPDTSNNPSAPSGTIDPASLPFAGRPASDAGDQQQSRGSYGQPGRPASDSADSLPSPLSNLAGEFLPSSSAATTGSGMPSSSSSSTPTNAQSSMGGMPLGSTSPASSTAAPGSSFSMSQDSAASSDPSNDLFFPPRPKLNTPMGSIQVPFEIVVVCRGSDVLLHPGGYRLTTLAMREQGGGSNGLLSREIRAIVRRRAVVDPMIRPKPAIRFLVEADGADAFWLARRQLLFSLPDWPMSLQVSSSTEPHVFSKETW